MLHLKGEIENESIKLESQKLEQLHQLNNMVPSLYNSGLVHSTVKIFTFLERQDKTWCNYNS